MTTAYRDFTAEIRQIAVLDSIGSLLHWDEQTYQPKGGTSLRADQQSLIAKLRHEQFISPRIGEQLAALEAGDDTRDPASDRAVNIREIRRLYDRARKLPTSLVEALTSTAVHGQAAWADARHKSDYSIFRPWLEKMLELKRQEARCYAPTGSAYDGLLEEFEPGETSANIQRTFDALRPRLVELVGRIVDSGRRAPTEILARTYPASLQDRLARDAAAAVGFDFDTGRLDLTVHPFCSGIGPGDTRLTTRYDDNHFGDGFFSVLHEVGHGLYEQGLPKNAHFGEPLAESISLGIHESQSRMWENLVGRSRSFWKFMLPRARDIFGPVLSDVSEDQWLFAVNDVRPSLIRTEADETTYNLHIMLRFELEQALLNDEVKARDLPAAWSERMKHYLGITPPDDARGCLQDVHWSSGAIGYFATYALGNLYAAQFFEQAIKELGNLDVMFARGEFAPLLGWLREKIHRHGRRYSAAQLVKQVTGSELSAEPLMRRLSRNAREFHGV